VVAHIDAGDVGRSSEWPPLFLYLARRSAEELAALDDAIGRVARHPNSKPKSVSAFLRARPAEDMRWMANQLELCVKSMLLSAGVDGLVFDAPLDNGRDTDARFTMNGRAVHLECTALGDSDEDRGVWAAFMSEGASPSDGVLVRPGRFDPPDAKGPSVYYDCSRMYWKVFDKLAQGFDPSKGQVSPNDPNILLVSIATVRGSLVADSPGIGWALDELLADQPRARPQTTGEPPHTAVSLARWLDVATHYAGHGDGHELITCPRQLGAIVIFDGVLLRAARLNYNAHDWCRMTHQEVADLEVMLADPPSFFI
jgi:hypothetical protein